MKNGVSGVRDTLRALRLYVSPVFFRENPAVYTSIAYGLVCCGAVYHLHGRIFWHDGRFTMPDFLAPFWWLLLQACFTALNMHYWRQIRSPSTFMLQRMQVAEYRAVHVALPLMFVLLALPVALLGAPVLNVMALESINAVVWSGADRVGPRDLRARMRVPRMILSLGAFMAMLVPSAQSRLLSAPWWVVAALLLVTVPMVLAEYRFRSYGMAGEVPVRTPRGRRARVPTPFTRAVAGVLMWQPPWVRRVPLPDGFASGSPLGFMLQVVVIAGVVGTFGMVVACVTEQTLPSSDLLHHSARTGVLQAVLFSTLGLVGWMRSRRDWPFLLSLGPFGGRRDFARAMYRAHGLRSLQAAVLAGAFLGGAFWALGMASAVRGWWMRRAVPR